MIVPSFLRPPADVVKDPWWEVRAGTNAVHGRVAKGWDYATPVDVVFRCDIALPELLSTVQLGPSSEVALVLRSQATGTGLRSAGPPRRVRGGSNEICLHLDGDSLGGTLVLDAALILSSASRDSGPLAPTRPGSVFWSDQKKVVLEGDSPRFPVELISFEAAGIRGPNAGWCLRWDSRDYDQVAGACLRLQFNSEHRQAKAFAESPGDPDNAVFGQVIRWDVTRQMILAALDDEGGFDYLDDWPERSLGAALAARIRTAFPGLSLDECRSLRRSSSEDFETWLQSAMGLFT